jgi:hypothetical protein
MHNIIDFCPFSSGHCVVCPSIYGLCIMIQGINIGPMDSFSAGYLKT